MLISELIEQLEKDIEKYGDVEVWLTTWDEPRNEPVFFEPIGVLPQHNSDKFVLV